MRTDEWQEVAELIYHSTNSWYTTNGKETIFKGPPADILLFCQVYEDLDAGCCLIAQCKETGKIAGSCFYHPRKTHVSLGIMNVSTDFFGQGIARNLLTKIIQIAEDQSLPVRLVSSAQNLDSFSLYTRQGFSPTQVFQDMYLEVPEDGFHCEISTEFEMRNAQLNDLEEMVALEKRLCGIERTKDFKYFIENKRGIWNTVVCRNTNGTLLGFLGSVDHPASRMIGPGVAEDEQVTMELLATLLDRFRGKCPVFLLPVTAKEAVQTAYSWGARNCEIHFSQCRGENQPTEGVVMPTFMPETG
jgi:GNAT superfamily N-acetyltransferase